MGASRNNIRQCKKLILVLLPVLFICRIWFVPHTVQAKERSETAVKIEACYTDGQLEKVSITEIPVSDISYPVIEKHHKIIYWSSLDTMLPIFPEDSYASTAEPTAEPTPTPTAEPTAEPTPTPTAEPTAEPTEQPTENPLAERKPDGGLTRIFKSITCIGDSLTSGVIDKPKLQDDGTTKLVPTTVASKSYPTVMSNILGIKLKNLGIGGRIAANDSESQLQAGKTVRSWLYKSRTRGFWKDSASDYAEAYIVALGTNDISRFGSFTGSMDESVRVSEQGIEIVDNTTSVGGYCEILNEVLEANPDAKIFCVTLPNTRGKAASRADMNAKIKQIAEAYRNTGAYIYLIDLERYGIQPDEVAEWKSVNYGPSHLNEAGYKWLAETYMTYIDYIIRHNTDDFKQLLSDGDIRS